MARPVDHRGDLGEGDPGDFDHGAWHIACHLVAASGVCRADDGRLLWLEVSHSSAGDDYYATVSAECDGGIETWLIASAEGRSLLRDSTVLGFVEGNSIGRTSARGVHDPPSRFNLWRRQDFDQPIDSTLDGGRVWEHWCTTRDIRPTAALGTSVLTARPTVLPFARSAGRLVCPHHHAAADLEWRPGSWSG